MNAMEQRTLCGKAVWTWRHGDGPVRDVIVVLEDADFAESLPAVEVKLDRACVLVGFGPLDWNRDLTPWPAPGLRKGEPFAGRGRDVLDWMLSALVPWIREAFGSANLSIAGYSLGGLMALWSGYESDVFSGCASCSGSLWYDGWDAYVAARGLPRPMSVYLSLGEAEEQARQPRLARVADATRCMAKRLEGDPNAVRATLRWHPGGHFNEPAARMADALAWLLEPTAL